MRVFYVYKLKDLNGNVFYVGKGSKTKKYNRINFHRNHWRENKNLKLKRKIQKLNGIFDVEFVLVSNNESQCLILEKKLIAEIGKTQLCNLTDGGEGTCGCEWNVGRRILEDKKIEIINLYKTKSIYEICDIIGCSFSTLKKYLVELNLYKKNKNRKPDSMEVRLKKSVSNKGKRSIGVFQYTLDKKLIKEFDSMTSACNFIGKQNRQGDIQMCCDGKQKTALGYIWSYKTKKV